MADEAIETPLYYVQSARDTRRCAAARVVRQQFTGVYMNTMENCALGNYATQDGHGQTHNLDGIIALSVQGLLFRNRLHNYEGCDTLADVGNRAPGDFVHRDHLLTIEGNVFSHGLLKNEGTGTPSNGILWVNNHFFSPCVFDYHMGWTARFKHNTFTSLRGSTFDWMWGDNSIMARKALVGRKTLAARFAASLRTTSPASL